VRRGHALHDGFTDLLNVLYPLLQAQFGLSYAAIGALKTVYSGAMASGQIPSGWLAGRLAVVLCAGRRHGADRHRFTDWRAFTGSLYGVIADFSGGAWRSTKHPIGSRLCRPLLLPGLRSRTASAPTTSPATSQDGAAPPCFR
jgi:MFS family permease